MHTLTLTNIQLLLASLAILSGAVASSCTAFGNVAKAFGKPKLAAKLLSLGHDFQSFSDSEKSAEGKGCSPPASGSAGFARLGVVRSLALVAILSAGGTLLCHCASTSAWWHSEGETEVAQDFGDLVSDYALKGMSLAQIAIQLGQDVATVGQQIFAAYVSTKTPDAKAAALAKTPAFVTAMRLRNVAVPIRPIVVDLDAGPDAK